MKFTILFILLSLGQLLAQNQIVLEDHYYHGFESKQDSIFLTKIKDLAQSARIIGLGELSHYTQECYEFKASIIQVLRKFGYEALILEVDFGQALQWNQYVVQGKGNLDSLIACSGWFTYRTEAFKTMLQEINQYNQTADIPFQIFGMEMTSVQDNLQWMKDFLEKRSDCPESLLDQLNNTTKGIAFQQYSDEERQAYWHLYFELGKYYGIIKTPSEMEEIDQDLIIAEHIIDILGQFCTYISQDDVSLQIELRDQFSARNVLWCIDQLSASSKCLIWAHNGHVAKQSILFNYDVLGHYLNKWFQDEYRSIGFTYAQGEYGAFSSDGFKIWEASTLSGASITQEFRERSFPFALYDIKSHVEATKTMHAPIFNEQLIQRDISEFQSDETSSPMYINLSKSYDYLIYIEDIHPPIGIEWIQNSNK